jgi:processive rubber oxygenase RoxA-like protein
MRPFRAILVLVALLMAGGIVYAVGRDRPTDYADDAEHYKYGSIGTEPGVSVFSPVGGRLPPEWIFRVLPQVCKFMPSYQELGLIYEMEPDGSRQKGLPVGISRRRRLGSDLIGVNCAFCHAGTYRTRPDSPPVVVSGMPPQQTDVQRLFRYIFECVRSSDFTTENVVREIRNAGGPSGLLDQLMYRLLIPATRSRVAELEGKLSVLTGDRIPRPGPGRLDTLTPAKSVEVGWDLEERLARYGLRDLVGNMDFSPTWNLARRKGMQVHWDGNLGDVHEAILSAVLAVGGKPQTVDDARLERVERFMFALPAPKYPLQVDGNLADAGKVVFDKIDHDGYSCLRCHEGADAGRVTPIEVLKTDRYRLDTFSREFSVSLPTAMNRNYARSEYRFKTFRKTDGYVNVLLDGIWARAPYLHNGSVPSLRDLLQPVSCRPRVFHRGSDVYDPENVGFESWAEYDPTCPPQSGGQGGSPPATAPNGAKLFLFDTSLPGNSNSGHVWGTTLSDADKTALLEYLKRL